MKKILASLVVLLLVSACGNDGGSGSALPLPNGNTNNAMVPGTPNQNTTVNGGGGTISVTSFTDFKSKVIAGSFVSYEQFVRQNNLNSSQNIGFYFSDCTTSTDQYLGGAFQTTSSGCDFGFYRFFSGGQLTRMDDGKTREEVKAMLTEIVNTQTGVLPVGQAKFQINKGTKILFIDLNYPLGLNPIGEFNSTTGNIRDFMVINI